MDIYTQIVAREGGQDIFRFMEKAGLPHTHINRIKFNGIKRRKWNVKCLDKTLGNMYTFLQASD